MKFKPGHKDHAGVVVGGVVAAEAAVCVVGGDLGKGPQKAEVWSGAGPCTFCCLQHGPVLGYSSVKVGPHKFGAVHLLPWEATRNA